MRPRPSAGVRQPVSRPACGLDRPRRARAGDQARAAPLLGVRARRAPDAAGRTTRRTGPPSSELELLVADLDRRAVLCTRRTQRAFELRLRRRRAEHTEAALRAQQAPL